jgi:hypothetical protein
MRKNRFVNRLQQTGTDRLMNLYGNVNNLFSNLVFGHPSHSLGVLGVLARVTSISLRKDLPAKCRRDRLLFSAYHALGGRCERDSTHRFTGGA